MYLTYFLIFQRIVWSVYELELGTILERKLEKYLVCKSLKMCKLNATRKYLGCNQYFELNTFSHFRSNFVIYLSIGS